MKNSNLAKDYLRRAKSRLKALNVLYTEQSWPDVVREAQEIVELSLKSLLRTHNIEIPRIHDVSAIILDNHAIFSATISNKLQRLCDISKDLRRDRELAFYGSEDLTPSDFYSEKDAKEARQKAKEVVEAVSSELE